MHELLQKYAASSLQCDGLTRELSTALQEHGIEHTCMVGIVILTGTHNGLPFHMWIDLSDGQRIDYRARMWLGDRLEIPHGIFAPADFPGVTYKGHPVPFEPLHPVLLAVFVGIEHAEEINRMKPLGERLVQVNESAIWYAAEPPQERCYVVPPHVDTDNLSDEAIAALENDIWLGMSGCDYYEYIDGDNPLEVREPEPQQSIPRIRRYRVTPRPVRVKQRLMISQPPEFPQGYRHFYTHILLAEVSAEERQVGQRT